MKTFRALEMGSLIWVYCALLFTAIFGDLVGQGDAFSAWQTTPHWSSRAYSLSAIIVFGFTLCSFCVLRMLQQGAELEKMLRQVLTPMSYLQILMLSSFGGISEEWFFRGYLQPRYGVL